MIFGVEQQFYDIALGCDRISSKFKKLKCTRNILCSFQWSVDRLPVDYLCILMGNECLKRPSAIVTSWCLTMFLLSLKGNIAHLVNNLCQLSF